MMAAVMMKIAIATWVQSQSLRQNERFFLGGGAACREAPMRRRGWAVVAGSSTPLAPAERADAAPLVRLATTAYSTDAQSGRIKERLPRLPVSPWIAGEDASPGFVSYFTIDT